MLNEKKEDILIELESKALDLLNSQNLYFGNWELTLDKRKQNKSLILFNAGHRIYLKICQEENKKVKENFDIKFYFFSSAEKLSEEILEQLSQSDNIGYSFTVENFKIKAKTEKIQTLLDSATSNVMFMLSDSDNFTKEEKLDFNRVACAVSNYMLSNGDMGVSVKKTYLFAQEVNIIANLLELDKRKIKKLFQLQNFKGLDGDMKYIPEAVNYLFERCRDKKYTKSKPFTFHNEKFYYFKNKGKELLFSQSQNSGYLFEKVSKGFKGYIFGASCIRKNLDELIKSGLNNNLSLKIENNKITFVDTWIDYNSFVIYPAVENLYKEITNDNKSYEQIIKNYQVEKRKESIDKTLIEKTNNKKTIKL